MGYVICSIAFFMLGRKYQELADMMLARRIAKMIEQRKQLSQERDDYEKYIGQDEKIGNALKGAE